MSNVDVQWPSEDEDFDAVLAPVSTGNPVRSRQTVTPRAVRVEDVHDVPAPAAPEGSVVSAVDEASFAAPAEPAASEESEPAPVQDVAPAAVEPAQLAEQAQAVSEPDTEPVAAAEPSNEPIAAAEPATTEAPKAVKPAKSKQPRVKGSRPYAHYAVEALLFLALLGVGFYALSLHNDKKTLKGQVTELNANPQVAVQKQTQSLLNTVGSLMQLPTNETPTIANVTDAAQAKQQSAFFNTAQNGDKVLMYVKAGEAILYRPTTNRIVLVAPLTFSNSTANK